MLSPFVFLICASLISQKLHAQISEEKLRWSTSSVALKNTDQGLEAALVRILVIVNTQIAPW
jgi:hypothetical protein